MATELEADICRDLYPRLVGALGLVCGDGTMAEDFAQEALVRLWERWAANRRPENPMAWCYRVGANMARSVARRRAIEQRILRRVQADRREADGIKRWPRRCPSEPPSWPCRCASAKPSSPVTT
jgi:predicted RNA polymerase sigma factor